MLVFYYIKTSKTREKKRSLESSRAREGFIIHINILEARKIKITSRKNTPPTTPPTTPLSIDHTNYK